MAGLGGGITTLLDVAKVTDPDGSIATLAELLHQTNPIIDDIPWVESNLPTGHRSSQRTTLPTPSWKLLNQGSAATKSTAAQIEDTIGILEDRFHVDEDIAELNGNTAEFRLQEAMAHIEGMSQEFVGTLFYGNTGTAPEEFNGFTPRFNSSTANNGQNVIKAGGAGSDNASIWLIGWSPNKVFCVYPKGSKAGLQHRDNGLTTITTTAGLGSSSARLTVYEDHWKWKCGLVVKDWRYVVRAPNIDISNLVAKSSAADLFDVMIEMMHTIQDLDNCNPIFYMNRTVFKMLHIQGRDDMLTGGIRYSEVAGKQILTFDGIPVKKCDQLTEAEDLVS